MLGLRMQRIMWEGVRISLDKVEMFGSLLTSDSMSCWNHQMKERKRRCRSQCHNKADVLFSGSQKRRRRSYVSVCRGESGGG